MYNINYDKLGEYIGKRATEYFNRWYSKDTCDYKDEISNANEVYDEDLDMFICSIELAEVGKPPLIIEYYYEYITDDKDKVIDTKYFIDNFA